MVESVLVLVHFEPLLPVQQYLVITNLSNTACSARSPEMHPNVVVVSGGEPEPLATLRAIVQLLSCVRRPMLQVECLDLEALQREQSVLTQTLSFSASSLNFPQYSQKCFLTRSLPTELYSTFFPSLLVSFLLCSDWKAGERSYRVCLFEV